jgi:hypothetical protein
MRGERRIPHQILGNLIDYIRNKAIFIRFIGYEVSWDSLRIINREIE